MSHPTPFPPVIDSSMLSAFIACPTQWRRRYLEGWNKPGTSIHLHFGAAFAKGTQAFRNHFYDPDSSRNIDESLAVAHRAAIQAWGSEVPPDGNGTNKSLERLLGALEAFFHHYNPITDWTQPHRASHGALCTEFSFAIPIPIRNPSTGEPLLYSGRFDQIVQTHAKSSDSIVLMGEDDKTTTQLGESWGRQWRLRGQFSGYMWGAREYGYGLEGFIVRGISILKREYGHAEVIEQRPPHMIEDWYENMLYHVQRMVSMHQLNEWPKALGDACSAYGGCMFQDLCVARDPEKWLSLYEYKPFDPLEVRD